MGWRNRSGGRGGSDSLQLLGLSGQHRHLGVGQGALLVDAVDAEVDGGAKHAVKVTGVVAHRTVPGGFYKVFIIKCSDNVFSEFQSVL